MRIKLMLISWFLIYSISFSQNCLTELKIKTNRLALINVDSLLFIGNKYNSQVGIGKHLLKLQEFKKWNPQILFDTIDVKDCGKILSKEYSFDEKNNNLNSIQLINHNSLQNSGSYINKQSFHETNLFKVLIGTAIAFGSTAAYYKIKADKKYDEYLIAKDKAILDQVNKYDLVSGISFGLLQINFGYLLYRFLTD